MVIARISETTLPKTYERLVNALHYVRQSCQTVPVLSIIWLHPKHPIHHVQETLLRLGTAASELDDRSSGRGLRGPLKRMADIQSRTLRSAVCAANAVRLSVKLLSLRWRERRKIEMLRRKQFDVVAKTWCFGLQRPSGEDDFYYGDLQQRLARRGHRMLLLCGDSSETNWRQFADAQLSTPDSNRIPELCLVPPWAPLKMLWTQLHSSRILKGVAANAPDRLVETVARTACLDVLSPSVTQNGLFYWIGREAVRTWKPRALVTLYEGHGWEKCMWWGAKAEDRACRTVGYQHTVVFPEAIGLTRPFVDIKERSVPDIILALGERTRDLIKDGHEKHQSHVIPFGTFRYGGRRVSSVAPAGRRHVLVIPEGLPFEIRALFDFAHECARLLPSHTFVLRSHPQWPISKALSELGLDVLDLPNVIASDKNDIDEDFARSSIVLYRGSSAVLYGLLAGLFPIYVHVYKKFDSDPLYVLQSWRKVCSTPEQFAELVNEYEDMSAAKRDMEWQAAAAYVSEYAVPVDEHRVDAFLAEIHS